MDQTELLEITKGHADLWKAGYQEGIKRNIETVINLTDALRTQLESCSMDGCGACNKARNAIENAEKEPKP